MTRRRLVWIVALTLVALWVYCGVALAKYRGSDVLGNLAPESQLGGGSLVERYPLSAYALDYHVDVGVTDLDGVPPTIAQWASAQLWDTTSFVVRLVIDVFSWAFSLDLLGGSPDRPGAVGPVAGAVSSLYEHVIGEAWLVAAITLAGIWGIWKALVQRRYSQTAASLAMSVCFVLVAMFFVYQPERTIGQASTWANQLSLAFLSGANRGTVDEPERAKRAVADQLFAAQVVAPWLALEFGGRRHCVNGTVLDADGFPRPVSVHDPSRTVCRDHWQRGRDGHGGYAARFLRHPPGSDERAAEYEALKSGQAPDDDPRFRGYAVDKADAPAVDIQQAGGAYQRLTLAIIVLIGSLGMVCLLGFLSLAVVLAQVVALVLLAFAPVALVVGVFPGAGHDVFRGWLTRLATAVFIKALYSLVIAVVVAVAAALGQATGGLGFLFAFGLQAVFYWAIFLYRRQITQRLVAATTGGRSFDDRPIGRLAQYGAEAAAQPFGALAGLPRRASRALPQESALNGASKLWSAARRRGDDPPEAPESDPPDGDDPRPGSPKGPAPASRPLEREHAEQLVTAAPVSSNGHSPGHADWRHHWAASLSDEADRAPAARPDVADHEPAANVGDEDVMRRARALREQPRSDEESAS